MAAHHDAPHDHDGGLAVDLPRLLTRRRALTLLGGVGVGVLAAACGRSPDGTTGAGSGAASPSGATGDACTDLPEETAGPFPGNGTNGPDVLSESGVVRRDIRSSFAGLSGTASGAPLTIVLDVRDLSAGCAPYEGAAVYLWHCDREARYSLYDRGVTDQNYLRGVQAADGDGRLSFETIFPGAYPGRYPHMHFEVYESLDAARDVRTKLATSQLALPADVCRSVYESADGYQASVAHLARTPIERDGVFRDGFRAQMTTVTGSLDRGLTATLTLAV